VPPFSGPRSRAAVAACNPQPHRHRCALQPWGATANRACARGHHHRPVHPGGMPRLCMPPGCQGRWLGARAQAPFAVAATSARTDAVDGATPANRTRCPASVGRSNAPGHLPLLHACTQPAPHGPLLAAPGPQPTARCERQPLTVHRLSSQAVRRTLNLGVGFLAANFVQRAASGDPLQSLALAPHSSRPRLPSGLSTRH